MAITTEDEKNKFIQAKGKGKSNRAAAMIAKPDIKPESAAVVGHRLANDPDIKPIIQKSAQQALVDTGVDMSQWMTVLVQAKDATKLIVHGKNSEDGWTEEVPDWSARLKAFAEAMKISGAYTQAKPQDDPIKQLTATEQEALQKRIDNGDVHALERIVFKSEPQEGTNEPIK